MEAQLTERASPLVDALLAHSGRCCLCGDPTAHPDRSLPGVRTRPGGEGERLPGRAGTDPAAVLAHTIQAHDEEMTR
jgi:hypothetical protein